MPWGSLKENPLGGTPAGSPARENSRRSSGLMSVTVPTVERGLPPRRFWSMTTAAEMFSTASMSGRPWPGQEGPDEGAEGLVQLPLGLGREGVEHQGRLARAGDTGEDGQLLSRDPQRDVLEVVLPGTGHLDGVGPHVCSLLVRVGSPSGGGKGEPGLQVACGRCRQAFSLRKVRVPQIRARTAMTSSTRGAGQQPRGAHVTPESRAFGVHHVGQGVDLGQVVQPAGRQLLGDRQQHPGQQQKRQEHGIHERGERGLALENHRQCVRSRCGTV